MIGGHGHVTPRPDGAKARCGGPGICSECSREQGRVGDNPRPITGTCKNCSQRITLSSNGWVHGIDGQRECPVPPVQLLASPVAGAYTPASLRRWAGGDCE